ncbi:MAG: type II toxin-antitoxin system HicB family antitoxin [Beijerinckiaceae bacterium]
MLPTHYVALIEKQPGTLYGVWFPDLPGCTSAGKTQDEAAHNAIEAARLWANDAIADGEDLPKARTIDELAKDPSVAKSLAAGGVATLVPLLVETRIQTRVNISMDTGTLAAIDAAAKVRGLTRSAFLTSAALAKIEG